MSHEAADHVFREAALQFRGSLSPHESAEFTEFSSAEDMLRELKPRVVTYRNKTKMLASNFSTFFDKLLVMLETISNRLPGYAEYYERLNRRKALWSKDTGLIQSSDATIPKFESNRVVRVISYIYKDIIQFCQEACQVFGTKKRGMRYELSAIANIFWKPFDVRFGNILERIDTHQALFLGEMQLEESKFSEFQYQKSQQDSDKTTDAISQIQTQISQLKQTILGQEDFLRDRFEHISEAMETLRAGKNHDDSYSGQRPSVFDTTFRHITKWVRATDFSRELRKAQEIRLHETGKWFLDSPYYKSFKATEIEGSAADFRPPDQQLVFVKAKPGYGKTVLSSLIIDDLANTFGDSDQILGGSFTTPPVLYYHFTSEKPEECIPSSGLRACLHQFIHRHRSTADVLDAISIIAGSDGSGLTRAADEEVAQCLLLLLANINQVFLVFDGVDECTDPAVFFKAIRDVCSHTGAKALLLGRPNIEPPRSVKPLMVVSLESWRNSTDIRAYLQPEVDCLFPNGLFPNNSNLDDIVTTLSTRAQGMFLWAKLIIRYLSNTWLSPRERINAIFNDAILDELDNLYGEILSVLERADPTQVNKARRVFQAMVVARAPLTLQELRHIVAINPGQVTREDDFIVDFEQCLPVMCGALVEYASNESVSFIHSSLRDYLLLGRQSRHSIFGLTRQSSWLMLTTVCLSYLTYDIPRGPITTTPYTAEQRALVSKTFPLLQFAVAQSNRYDRDIFDVDMGSSGDEDDRKFEGLLSVLTHWIEERRAVTAWIEASFSYWQLPSIQPLISMIELSQKMYSSIRLQVDSVISSLSQLEQDLAQLRDEWTGVLLEEPSAMWTSTVTAFAKSSYWTHQNDTSIKPLGNHSSTCSDSQRGSGEESRMILIKSQTSSDRLFNASIYVKPSRQYIDAVEESQRPKPENPLLHKQSRTGFESLCNDWKVNYQIKNIKSVVVPYTIEVDLPTEDVLEILRVPMKLDINLDKQDAASSWRFTFPVSISPDLSHVLVLRTLITLQPMAEPDKSDYLEMKSFSLQRLKQEGSLKSESLYSNTFSPTLDAIGLLEKRETTKGAKPGNMYFVDISQWEARNFQVMKHIASCSTRLVRALRLRAGVVPRYGVTEKVQWLTHNFGAAGAAGNRKASDGGDLPSVGTDVIFLENLPDELERNIQMTESNTVQSQVIPSQQRKTLVQRGDQFNIFPVTQTGKTGQVVAIESLDGKQAQFGHVPSLRNGERTSLTMLPFGDTIAIVWDKISQPSYSITDSLSPHLPCVVERTLQSMKRLTPRSSTMVELLTAESQIRGDSSYSSGTRPEDMAATQESSGWFGQSPRGNKRASSEHVHGGEEKKTRVHSD
ncbi:hypothetical protein JX265_010076 [Neoarthrinium moseri]|uniref:Nephrocystin 3-like N-terminal domain-containing protein n=1 Tax=Neoarthrinium moseri TaxID=1658444 RepID=A0A9P9WF64_9PEZI|nr:hypothetical protein JX265_010076 [Neoarthrinium moseri]